MHGLTVNSAYELLLCPYGINIQDLYNIMTDMRNLSYQEIGDFIDKFVDYCEYDLCNICNNGILDISDYVYEAKRLVNVWRINDFE